MTERKFKDNRPEFKKRLAEHYNLPGNDPIAEAMLESAAILVNRGMDDASALSEAYSDLICPWWGQLHYSPECQKRLDQMK